MSISSLKVASLPTDLKKIAEELIGEKFPEEVKAKRPATFRGGWDMGQGVSETYYGVADMPPSYHPGFSERQRGYKEEIRVDIRPWDRCRVATLRVDNPSFRALHEAYSRFRMENIRGDMAFVMDRRFINELLGRDEEFYRYFLQHNTKRREGEENAVGQIMGIKVVVLPDAWGCKLQASF